jgi:hypothetical protein
MRHRYRSIFPRLLAVFGAAGLLLAIAVWSPPGASAAAFSATAVKAKAETPACSANVSKSLRVTTPNLLKVLHPKGQYLKPTKKNPAHVVLSLTGKPSLDLNLSFSGQVNCKKSLASVTIPIADTSLRLKVTPELVFNTSGKVQADYTWTENINIGFTAIGDKVTEGTHSLTSSSQVSLTGLGTAKLALDLDVVVETPLGIVGVEGVLGPQITASVDNDECWTGSYSTDATFSLFVNALFFEEKFTTPTWQLGNKVDFQNCLYGGDE